MFPSLLHWLCVLGKCNRKPEIISLWREWKSVRHFPSWVWVDKRVTNDPVEPHRSALRRWRRGGGRAGGGVGRKSDVTPSFIHPSTPVATATWPRGTQERRHGWQKQHSGRKWLRANESKLDRRGVWRRAERGTQQRAVHAGLWTQICTVTPARLWPSGARPGSLMKTHSSLWLMSG